MFCIVGADGFFGAYMLRAVLREKRYEKILAFNHTRKIIEDTPEVRNEIFELGDFNSIDSAAKILSDFDDINIFFLASAHNPDIIKRRPQAAEKINAECYEYFLDKTKNLNIKKLIYASSDTVYGESVNLCAFSEKDKTEPINIYGKQKLLAEKITLKHKHKVARFPYLAGPSLTPKKKHFFDRITEKLKRGQSVNMLTDYVRSSISYETAANLAYRLFSSGSEKSVVNICADIPVTKYQIGLKIAQFCNADPSLIIPCTTDELGVFSEKRAKEIIMDNSLLKQELGINGEIKLDFNEGKNIW